MRMNWAPIRLLPLIVLALCPVTTTGTAARAATTYGCTCDVAQGFHHSSGGTATVGYLVTATIAGRTLAADISVSDPQSGATTSVVGVISSDAWRGGVSDPITMTAYISTANRQRLAALTQSDLYNATVLFNFANDVWDPNRRTYYDSFAPASPPLRAQLTTNAGGNPTFALASTPGPVESPQNYAMSMTVVPPPGSGGAQQQIRVASSSTTSDVRVWGTQTAP